MESKLDEQVLNAIAANAATVCNADDVVIHLIHGDQLRRVGHFGPFELRDNILDVRLARTSIIGAAVLTGARFTCPTTATAVHIPIRTRPPSARPFERAWQHRCFRMMVPSERLVRAAGR